METMIFEETVKSTLRFLKAPQSRGRIIAIGASGAGLRPVDASVLDPNDPRLPLIMTWRRENRESFFTWVTVTEEGTRRWLATQVLERPDRILFMAEFDGTSFGHLGLTNFDFEKRTCEIDNVLRGNKNVFPGGMRASLQALLQWTFATLECAGITLRVFADNARAIRLYESSGFRTTQIVPVNAVTAGDETRWIESPPDSGNPSQRHVAHMEMRRVGKAM